MDAKKREKIIKVLEHCAALRKCGECPFVKKDNCGWVLGRDALALVKELTEENERLRAEKKAAIEDLEHCMYFAKPKRPNTCNFCTHDCEVSKDGTRCKGKEDWIYCSPVWRGFVKPKAEGE